MSREIGNKGEALAAAYLLEKGYSLLEQNYRHKRGEIDIIAQDGNSIVFIEVKLRKSNSFGYPESFVDDHKMNHYVSVADHYLALKNWEGELRFDVIAITGSFHIENSELDIQHFKDVFYPEN